MTAKRFILIDAPYENGEPFLYKKMLDKTTKKEYDNTLKGIDDICDLANKLHEENQDLKSFNEDLAENLSVCANSRISKDNQLKRLAEKIQRERTSFTKTHERWSKEAETKIKELSEENKQLKKALWCIRKRYGYTVEEFIEDLKDNGIDLTKVGLE